MANDCPLTAKEIGKIYKQYRAVAGKDNDVIKDKEKIYKLASQIGLDKMVYRIRYRSTGKDETLVDEQFKKPAFKDASHNQGSVHTLVDLILQLFDTNKDGGIDFRELVSAMSATTKGTAKDKAKLQFKLFDVNGDGQITFDEVQESGELITLPWKFATLLQVRRLLEMKKTPESKIEKAIAAISDVWDEQTKNKNLAIAQALFDYADSDHDGFVTLDEYIAWQVDPKGRAAFVLKIQQEMKEFDDQFGELIEEAVREALNS
eukprot:CAMPEP_0201544462 /NCGR_PEP_ID=MMETSP0173_2-20130828/1078_1 /ASSEMBLY_ACC=CAM_ASM_000268 /TAXON_ID=218659 /ORGANISM="Vexillifera sp., Strain DIVA3 564/2" /LENGTH=261 /DNA_ID=CAMNT_0047952587 /DNA_START=90 /DNA_END=875 /DNA_ORIENTATION=-